MEGIQLSVEKAGAASNISIVKVGGYIDTTTSAELEHSLGTILRSGNYNIILDLSNVDYISSAGWGIFISEIKGIRERGGDLKLVGMVPDVYEVFELLEFHYLLKAYDSVEDAIREFDSSSGEPPSASPPVVSAPAGYGAESGQPAESVATMAKPVTVADEGTPVETNIESKIRKLVMENPEGSTLKIMRELNTPRYQNTKVGFFELRRYLKKMGLDSKSKRVSYFKRKAFG